MRKTVPHLARTLRITLALSASTLILGCVSAQDVMIQKGSLDLNQRLRHDAGPTVGAPDGRFFANGNCSGAPAGDTDCRFVSQVQGSLVTPSLTHRLRKADFLWVAGGNGFAQLSYEFIAKGLDIVDRDDPSNVFFTNLTVGTCDIFPARDPESREWILEKVSIPEPVARDFVQQFDVAVNECTAPTTPNTVSSDLVPIDTNCIKTSVRDRLAGNFPPSPQNAPFCVLELGWSALAADVSFSVTPGAASQVNIADLWPDVSTAPRALLPNLKTVPIDGTRTISRPLTPRVSPTDGLSFFVWRVDVIADSKAVFKDRWEENFSPNIFVTRARVRKGPWVPNGTNYLPIVGLQVGPSGCQTKVPGSNDTEFDIPMCQINSLKPFRVTPAYKFDTISQQRVDDADRLTWEVRVNTSDAGSGNQLFLELDLAVSSPVGTASAGLHAQPGARDLGSLRVGPTAVLQPGFIVRNIGTATVLVESIALQGYDAAEFGSPFVYRPVLLGGAATASAPPPLATLPLMLQSGSALEIKLRPRFQSIGSKRTEAVVHYRDIQNTPQSISMPLYATAVTPSINMFPEDVRFVATRVPGPFVTAQARRAVQLQNSGTIDIQRTAVAISGPQASNFRVLSGQVGSTSSDLSQPVTVGPGRSETYQIGFFPQSVGESHATLIVSTSEGQITANLSGQCKDHCQQRPELTLEEHPSLPPVSKEPVDLKLEFPAGTVEPNR